ncbi:MAG: GNAT superfamily N-acetyltransferase [Flavobacteriales bacterium]|jgi:GNAT superfamily N-acetyltransferase
MDTIKINNKTYDYVVDFKNDALLRVSFNHLTRKVYGFDFEDWYLNGYWGDRYIPYSLLNGGTMISSIFVNVIDFLVQGEKRTYAQIGTVMTDPEHRNQGLNRLLLEKVLKEWRGKCDLIYLFANDSVLDFYPKFGFKRTKEYQYSRQVALDGIQSDFKKLNMSKKENKEFLLNKINRSISFSQVSMSDSPSLPMFHCTANWTDNVYYMKEFDTVVVADFEEDVLYLKDVFCENDVSLDELISALINKNIKKVVLGFTPKDITSFDENILIPADALFILDDRWGLFDNEKLQFPVLSHA